jgi:hypothetical protein
MARWELVITIETDLTCGDIRSCLNGICEDVESYADFKVIDAEEVEVS